MPGPRIRASKHNIDARVGSLVDMAFDSDYNLNKIARAIKSTSQTAVAHGLPYTPKVVSMREITTGKFGGGGLYEVDSTNIKPTISTHKETYGYGTTTYANDVATWSYVLVDPLVPGTYKKDMEGKPKLLVGIDTGTDYDYKIHSGYDTFKVAKTGRLTINADIYDPGTSGGVRTLSATVNHGLGYAPMFAPFVPFETEREAYLSWNGQYNTQNYWTSGYLYHIGEEAYDEDAGKCYRCKKTHIASASNKPESGAEWTTYWDYSIDRNEIWQSGKYYNVGDTVATEWYGWFRCIVAHTSNSTNEPPMGDYWDTYWNTYTEPDYYDTYVNKLEDQKFVYGGVEAFNLSYIKYYSTSTQLVLELTQVCAPDQPPGYEYTPCPAEKVYVDYTIFYNPAGEEFNLL